MLAFVYLTSSIVICRAFPAILLCRSFQMIPVGCPFLGRDGLLFRGEMESGSF
jgi:hypothetical protein